MRRFPKLRTDGNGLRTELLAAAAADAERSITFLCTESRCHQILLHALAVTVRIAFIITAEATGNIDAVRTGHTVAAARAGDLHFLVDGGLYFFNYGEIRPGKAVHTGFIRNTDILVQHFHRIHPRQNDGYFRLVVKPAQSPLRR